jgi:hypothetical protein
VEFVYFQVGDTVLEQGVRFYTKPPNSITIDFTDSGNIEYWYQEPNPPGLSSGPDALDGDCWRPLNVRDSYAIYKTGWAHNKYRTGKIAHLYRWEFTDNTGKREYIKKQTITKTDATHGTLKLEFFPQFLNQAEYPILLMGAGDTWGHTSEGASNTFENSESVVTASLAVAGGGAPAAIVNPTWKAYICQTRAGTNARAVIYTDTGADDPNAFVAQNGSDISITDDNCGGGQLQTASITCSLTSGNQYHAGFSWDHVDGAVRMWYDSTANYYIHKDAAIADYTNPPATFDINTEHSTRRGSVWLDYTPVAGGMSVPIATANIQANRRRIVGTAGGGGGWIFDRVRVIIDWFRKRLWRPLFA